MNNDRKASDSVNWLRLAPSVKCLDNLLIGDVLELARRTNKFPPDLVSKLDDGEEVADAKSKAHRVFCATLFLIISV